MSEYQFYHFLAVDKPLNRSQMDALREISTRAEITPSSFLNHYNYGDLRGDARQMLRQYFDALIYTASWGTHQFMLKFPREVIDLNGLDAYVSECLDITVNKEYVIIDFKVHDEDDYDDYDDEETGNDWMASLIPLRESIMKGDLRSMYLGWLAAIREEDDELEEPPMPPGLSNLSGPLQALADFLRIDEHLLEVVAQDNAQISVADPSQDEMETWVSALSVAEKNVVLTTLLASEGEARTVASQLRQRFLKEWRQAHPTPSSTASRRMASELLEAREDVAQAAKHHQAEVAARKRAEREREQAEQRKIYLATLASREGEVWKEIETLLTVTQAKNYDEAVRLLADLREVAANRGALDPWQSRVADFRQRYARRSSLMQRFDRAAFP